MSINFRQKEKVEGLILDDPLTRSDCSESLKKVVAMVSSRTVSKCKKTLTLGWGKRR